LSKIREKRLDLALSVVIALLLAFIWGNSMLPVEKSDALSRWVLEHVFGLSGGAPYFDTGNHLLRKAAHITEFALLAAALVFRMRNKRFFWLFGALAAAAAAVDETIQLFSHRGSQLKDVGIDCIGVFMGAAAAFIIIRKKQERRGRS
jgi:VanZ family protein